MRRVEVLKAVDDVGIGESTRHTGERMQFQVGEASMGLHNSKKGRNRTTANSISLMN